MSSQVFVSESEGDPEEKIQNCKSDEVSKSCDKTSSEVYVFGSLEICRRTHARTRTLSRAVSYAPPTSTATWVGLTGIAGFASILMPSLKIMFDRILGKSLFAVDDT